jgi:hypothetical protein
VSEVEVARRPADAFGLPLNEYAGL